MTDPTIMQIHNKIKLQIEARLDEFRNVWHDESDEEIFAELVFCILTPQSKARTCWQAVESLVEKNLLVDGKANEILAEVCTVRFKNNKTRYIIEARRLFLKSNKLNIIQQINSLGEPADIRSWLVENVKGIGMKEASHFLRNIGMGGDLAILDRHILRNLMALGVIGEIPKTISPKQYLAIENQMSKFSRETEIPMDHLDIVLWYKETGEIFK